MQARGILLDLEGVLYQGNDALPGTADAFRALSGSGFEIRRLTNTTTKLRETIADRLADMGFDLKAEHVFTPPLAAARLLERDHVERIHLAAAPGLAVDLSGFQLVDDHPEAIILGDLHLGFTWHRLNALFQMLERDVRLVALHKNRYCRRDQRIALDFGGAKAVVMQTIQIETGKFRSGDLHHPSIQPDRRIASAMELPQILISDVCKPK